MRFMMMIKSDGAAEAGVLPDQEILNAMGRFNEEMVNAGVMLAGEGLQQTAKGKRLRLAGTQVTITDGPFAEAKEVIAGFWLIQTRTKAEAVEWAKRVPGGEIELRPLYELSDFPVDPSESAQPEGWRDQEQQFRDAQASTAGPARKPGTVRYMVILRADRVTEAGGPPNPKVLAEMGALIAEMVANGAMLSGEGLKPSAEGVRVTRRGGARTVVDGPFTESKELVAGYSIIQVASIEEALDYAKRQLEIHAHGMGVDEGEVEIRPLYELAELPLDGGGEAEGWRQREIEMRARMARG